MKRQSFPKKLKVGGHIYRICIKEINSNDCGFIDKSTNTIILNKSNTLPVMVSSLIHELIHAFDMSLTESQVESLENQIFAFLVDNKFIKFKQ